MMSRAPLTRVLPSPPALRKPLLAAVGDWYRSWPVSFRALAYVSLVSAFALVAYDSFMAPYLRDHGVSVVAIGALQAATGVVSAIGSALAGAMADRYGRRAVLAAGRALRLLGWAVVLAAPRQGALVAVAALIGLGMAGGSIHMTMVGEASPKGRRASGYAVIGALDATMAMLVPVTIGLLADAYGLRTALCYAFIPGACGLLLITRLVETGSASPAQHAARPSWLDGGRFLLSPAGRGSALMGAVWLVTGFEMGLMRPVLPLYVQDRFGVSYAGLGMVATISAVGAILGQLMGGTMADRVGNSRLMMICVGMTAGVYALVPQARTPAAHTALMTLAGFCACLAAPCWGATSANVAPRAVRGSVTGLFSSTRSLGMALGGLSAGFAYRRSITMPLYLMVGSELCIFALVAYGARRALAGFGKGLVHDD